MSEELFVIDNLTKKKDSKVSVVIRSKGTSGIEDRIKLKLRNYWKSDTQTITDYLKSQLKEDLEFVSVVSFHA